MKIFVPAKYIIAGLLAIGICSQSSANLKTRVDSGAGQLSEQESTLLQKLKALNELELVNTMEYGSGRGATQVVELAIREGLVSPDTQMVYTLLTAAATNGHLETVKMLISRGADIELKDSSQDTPVKAAAREGRLDIVNYLLSQGANPNATGKSGSTPLSSAAYAGHIDVIDALLKNGAIITTNNARWTLVHYAARYGHAELIEYFVDKGIDLTLQTGQPFSNAPIPNAK